MMRKSGPAPVVALAMAAALLGGAAPAMAWEFDASLGQIKTTGVVSWSCEGSPEALRVAAYDEQFELLPEGTLDGRVETLEEALEGAGAIRMGGTLSLLSFDLRPFAEEFAGHRVAFTVWSRSEGTAIEGRVYWYAGANNEDDEERDYIGSVSLKPTGQATSDGWREYSTGPVDWNAGDASPLQLTIQDSHLEDAYRSYLAFNRDQTVLIDALEIEAVGEGIAPSGSCTAGSSAEVCGDQAACLWGTCVDGAILTDTLPDARIKSDYLVRRHALFELLEGGVLPQARIPAMIERFNALKGAESALTFWSEMTAAVASIQDGHASAPLPDYPSGRSGGVCLVMGEADRLPEGGALPMVFSRAEALPLGERLEVGDVLVAVDGVAPYDWLKSIPRAPQHAGDPVVGDYVLTPNIMGAALQAGSVVTFARCTNMERACTAEEVETIEIDLNALAREGVENIWLDGRPEWTDTGVACDWRFARWVEDAPNQAARYSYAGAAERDGFTYLLINGTPDPDFRRGDWRTAVQGGLEAESRGVLLDHRQGGGGTVTGVNLVAGYMLDPEGFGHIDWFPFIRGGLDTTLYEVFRTCQDETYSLTGCGGSYYWDIFEQHPEPGLHKDQPLAIVIGQDVSGNDFLTEVLRYREAPTRIFGSPATYGAFGTVIEVPALIGEFSGGSVQISDSIFFAAPWEFASEGELPLFMTGVGVPPDEALLQRQSDAMMGVDTVLTRAQQWLEEVQQ